MAATAATATTTTSTPSPPQNNTQTTHSATIYHGIPTSYPLSPGRHTAIVCGANGISGQAMLRVLAEHPDERWDTVWAISRSAAAPVPSGAAAAADGEGEAGMQIRYLEMDLLGEGVARGLREGGVRGGEGREGEGEGEAVIVFWFAYLDGRDDDNVNMLKNFIEGCKLADVPIKRLILQTGGKHYGVHQGPYKVPAKEDDPRLDLGPNFYYRQEDLLSDLAPTHGFDYVIIRPMTIIGAVKGNFLNLAMALGLYLSVTKELGDTPIFNGSFEKYHSAEELSSATLNAYFSEFTALTPSCSNESFNITNGDISVWARLWPIACSYFGLVAPEDPFSGPAPRPQSGVFPTAPPISQGRGGGGSLFADAAAARPARWSLTNSLVQWSGEERTRDAWARLVARSGGRLQADAFPRASWTYADRNMAIGYNKLEDISKARRFGWLGYVDSTEVLLEAFEMGREVGILP